jgi:hypothetical protein
VVGFLLFCLNYRIQLKDTFNKVGLTTTTWYDVARPMSRNMHGQIELSLKFTLKQVWNNLISFQPYGKIQHLTCFVTQRKSPVAKIFNSSQNVSLESLPMPYDLSFGSKCKKGMLDFSFIAHTV